MLRKSLPRRQARRGAVVVMVAICLVLLMTVVAIDLDGGRLLDERRHVQASADASALAAAAQMYKSYAKYAGSDGTGAVRQAAKDTAEANGYKHGTACTVTVQIHPESYLEGPNAGKQLPKGYIEVIIEADMERAFSGIVGSGTLKVKARAVARGMYEPADDGIILLDLDASPALNLHGNGVVNVSGSGKVIVNSSGEPAANITNAGASMSADGGYSVVGTVESPGGFGGGEVKQADAPVPDPLRFLPDPTTLGLPSGSVSQKGGAGGEKTFTYSPGDFRGTGMHKYDDLSQKINIIMLPGIYIFNQFEWSGQAGAYMLAQGVMIYIEGTSTSNTLKIAGQGNAVWTPYNSSTDYTYYNGISFFQNRESESPVRITGNGNFNITGTFYAPSAPVMLEGNGDASIGSQWISRTLDVGGNGNLNVNYSAAGPPGVRVLQLVE